MLDMNKTALLITGCIKPNPNAFQLSLTDVNLRLQQYYMERASEKARTYFCKLTSRLKVDNINLFIKSVP